MQSNDTAPRQRAPRRPPVMATCEVCSTPFKAWPSAVDAGRARYCGAACFFETRRRGERRTCEQCGSVFYAKPNHIKRGNGRYCSKPCFDEVQRSIPIEDRLWPRVDKNGPMPEHGAEYGNCWIKVGALNVNGYGIIYRHFPNAVLTHRLAWELATGETLTSDEPICHVCDVKACLRNDSEGTYEVDGVTYVRRGHLYKATVPANNADMAAKGRAGWHQTANRRRGEAQNLAKLTAEKVRWARAQYATGMPQQAIADALNVKQTTISRVILRQTWKHID